MYTCACRPNRYVVTTLPGWLSLWSLWSMCSRAHGRHTTAVGEAGALTGGGSQQLRMRATPGEQVTACRCAQEPQQYPSPCTLPYQLPLYLQNNQEQTAGVRTHLQAAPHHRLRVVLPRLQVGLALRGRAQRRQHDLGLALLRGEEGRGFVPAPCYAHPDKVPALEHCRKASHLPPALTAQLSCPPLTGPRGR